jgi:hypothetical protein
MSRLALCGGPRVIGLAGKMGVGKDTVAAMLRMRGYKRLGFADCLRHEVAQAIKERNPPAGLHPEFAAMIRKGRFTEREVYAKPTGDTMRTLLQYWGTEFRRANDPLYWIDKMAICAYDNYVISDLRFANEADWVREQGGKVWLITGRMEGWARSNDPHESEQINLVADIVIDNNASMYELAGRVVDALGVS